MLRNNSLLLAMVAFFLTNCTESVSRDGGSRILTMGDSLLAWHAVSGRSISNSVEDTLGEQVIDRSVIGARVLYALPISGSLGLKIAKQYAPGKWDWVILNGGGNDMWLGCGCIRCDRKINKLISEDGHEGGIPKLVANLRNTGARVVYVGYLRSPGVGSPIEYCKEEGDKLEGRIATMAAQDDGIYFLSLADLVPNGDRSYHSIDMIHPSVKASKVIGERVAEIIRSNDPRFATLE